MYEAWRSAGICTPLTKQNGEAGDTADAITEDRMMDADHIAALRRDMRRLKIALASLGIAGASALLIAAAPSKQDARFATITAERINIVEPGGLFRAVLTNSARSPGPMKQAREGAKEGTRNFPFAGLVIYDQDGQEQGGYGTGAAQGQGSLGVSTLDWPGGKQGGFGEAVVSFRRVDPEGKASSAVHLVDRPPPGEDPRSGADRRRIKLQSVDRDAEVVLADAQGRDRIRLRVDKEGDASIEIVDQAGRTVFRAPERKDPHAVTQRFDPLFRSGRSLRFMARLIHPFWRVWRHPGIAHTGEA